MSARTSGNGLPAHVSSADWRQRFRRRLLAWYGRHARDLPWRRNRNLYHIWVSEIMLQQTQVATVTEYFGRFIKAFPTVGRLASAKQQDVLRQWEGLGYYRRARQLHQAARQIVRDHHGKLPDEVNTLCELPGIGRYTAGAILSIGLDARVPILEANTTRLFCRLLAYRDDPTRAQAQRLLWKTAEQLLPRKNTGQFNQALMELGSLVCLPARPLCQECPVASMCPTLAQHLQEQVPMVKLRPPIEQLNEAAVVVRRGAKILLLLRGDDERWAGLWDFPRFPIKSKNPAALRKQLAADVKRLIDLTIEPLDHLGTIKHSVTRYRITLECHLARYVSASKRGAGSTKPRPKTKWFKPAELKEYPLSVPARKLAQLVSSKKKG